MDMKKVPSGIYIPDDLGKLFTVDEWMQRAHPETARTLTHSIMPSDSGVTSGGFVIGWRSILHDSRE